MIETTDGGSVNEDEIDDELDNYLDNLENSDSDWLIRYEYLVIS